MSTTKKLQTPGPIPAALNENLYNYLENLPYKECVEDTLYKNQRSQLRPIIYKDTARVIELFVLLNKPEKVLEIGTHSGFSTICLSKHLPPNGKIDTIEFRVDHIREAMDNIYKYSNPGKINFHQGKALSVLNSLFSEDFFDLIFIDADKQTYPEYLDYASKHLNSKGIILVDNLLWKGAVFSDNSELVKKPSTKTIRNFNRKFVKLKGFHCQILPVGDGLGIAIKL